MQGGVLKTKTKRAKNYRDHVEVTEIRCILKIELTGYRIGLMLGGGKGMGSKVTPVLWGGTEWLKKPWLGRRGLGCDTRVLGDTFGLLGIKLAP